MTLLHFSSGRPAGGAQGQATFEMANLRPQKTGLPFVVFVSQRDDAQHDVRVKVSHGPKVFAHQMSTYGVRPFSFVAGQRLLTKEERLLEDWIKKNEQTLIDYWNGDIEYTEEMLDKIVPV
jgi:hypothetical protein